jgi:hypothetical protein
MSLNGRFICALMALAGTGVAQDSVNLLPRVATALSVTPSSGHGHTQTFVTHYTSTAAGGVRHAYFWLGGPDSSGSAANTCQFRFGADPPVEEGPYLRSDDDLAWLKTVPLAVSNSQCTLTNYVMTNSNNNMDITWSITFKTAFNGPKTLWIRAVDYEGDTGWKAVGTWTVEDPPPPPPTVITVSPMSPANGGGYSQYTYFTADDSRGTSDLLKLELWFTPSFNQTEANTCRIEYDVILRQISLRNDAGTAWATSLASQVSNSQCSVGTDTSVGNPSTTSLTIAPSITFLPEYPGPKEVWMRATGATGDSGWQKVGTWTVPQPIAVYSIGGPLHYDSLPPLWLNFGVYDIYGMGDIKSSWISIAAALTNQKAGTCTFYYDAATHNVVLLDDAGFPTISGTPGLGPVTLSNSQCSIPIQHAISTLTADLEISVPVNTTPAFAGLKEIWMYAAGNTSNTGWQKAGTWNVQAYPPPPVNVSVVPASGAGISGRFVFRFDDGSGGANLASAWMWFKKATDAGDAATCKIGYFPASGYFNLLTDSGYLATGGRLGDSTPMSNSQCSIDLSTSTVKTTSGLEVTLDVTFPAAYGGVKETRMRAMTDWFDTGFQLMGSWSISPPAPVTGMRFVPAQPCRAADTRNASGAFGGPRIAGGTTRTFVISNSACNIPPTALAYALNIAVVPAGPLGYITVWPAGQNQPLASTLNSLDGRVKSNAAIVPAGTGGAISVFASNTTELVLDITGYFVPVTVSSALAFYPLTPCRIADTRNATGLLGGPSLAGGETRTLPVRSATACNVPASAQAYSLNFAAVPKGPLGYVTAWGSAQSMPPVSTLNAPTGTVTANAAIVPAGAFGSIDVFASNATDLIVDINGYFADMTTGGLSLYNVTPCRVLDTRVPAGALPFSGQRTVPVSAAACGIPLAAQAHVVSATVVPPGPLGYLTLWAQGESQPTVASLNALDGAVTSNLAIVPTTNGSMSSFSSNPVHLVLDISGYFAP